MVQTALLTDHRTKLGITFTILVVHVDNLINHINALGYGIEYLGTLNYARAGNENWFHSLNVYAFG